MPIVKVTEIGRWIAPSAVFVEIAVGVLLGSVFVAPNTHFVDEGAIPWAVDGCYVDGGILGLQGGAEKELLPFACGFWPDDVDVNGLPWNIRVRRLTVTCELGTLNGRVVDFEVEKRIVQCCSLRRREDEAHHKGDGEGDIDDQ